MGKVCAPKINLSPSKGLVGERMNFKIAMIWDKKKLSAIWNAQKAKLVSNDERSYQDDN